MKEENKDKLKCNNIKCGYNKEGYCTILTQSQVLHHRITCKERKW
jgi:hypothetical protein